jgi:hypothetical protein
MSSKKQKLELTWIGKENRPKLEPRILLEDPAKSYHAKHRVASADLFDNRLIFGDNLLALKALEGEFSGKVKCVFIDPPYNTGSAFHALRRRGGAFHLAVADARPAGDHPSGCCRRTVRCGSPSTTTRRITSRCCAMKCLGGFHGTLQTFARISHMRLQPRPERCVTRQRVGVGRGQRNNGLR